MSRNSQLQLRKEQKIKDAYTKWKKQNKYTSDYIFSKLKDRFDLEPRTIHAIVFGEYDHRRQKSKVPVSA